MAKEVDVGALVDIYGGQFRLTSVVQRRLAELVKGARPLVEVPRGRKDLIDIALQELEQGRIEPVERRGVPDVEDIFKPGPEEE